MIFELPIIPGASDQDALILLDGARYLIRWRWNDRGAFWAIDVRSEAGAAIALGMVARTGARLFSTRRSAPLPPGDLIIVGPPDESDPTIDSFGTLHRALYMDAEELAGR